MRMHDQVGAEASMFVCMGACVAGRNHIAVINIDSARCACACDGGARVCACKHTYLALNARVRNQTDFLAVELLPLAIVELVVEERDRAIVNEIDKRIACVKEQRRS